MDQLPPDTFIFTHQDSDAKITFEFQEIFADKVVGNFINFLRGCGYLDGSVYDAMQQFADEYYDSLNQQHIALNQQAKIDSTSDVDSVLG